jgi:predicted metal-dependent peptidase
MAKSPSKKDIEKDAKWEALVREASEKILREKILLQHEESGVPFLYALISKLKLRPISQEEWDRIAAKGKRAAQRATASIDPRGNLLWSPEYITGLSSQEVRGVLAHEALHVALLHLLRCGGRDMDMWNTAIDIVVNTAVASMSLRDASQSPRLPEGGLIPQHSSDKGWTIKIPLSEDKKGPCIVLEQLEAKSAEHIYEELQNQASQKGGGGGGRPKLVFRGHDLHQNGNSVDPETGESTPIDQSTSDRLANEWRRNLAEAAQVHKTTTRGTLPGTLEQLFEEVLRDRTDWRSVLYRFITQHLPSDFTWSRPSKKSLALDTYFPLVIREGIEGIVAIDTSGSMSDELVAICIGEVQSILRSFTNISIRVITCDAKVQDCFELTGEDAPVISRKITIRGRGGTSHVPVAKYIKKHFPHTKFILCLTDLATEFPEKEDKVGSWIWAAPRGCQEYMSDVPDSLADDFFVWLEE